MNPLYEQTNQINMDRLTKSIENFKRNFHGDPKAEVERMLQTGQMSQEQFNRLAQQANQIMQMLSGGHR